MNPLSLRMLSLIVILTSGLANTFGQSANGQLYYTRNGEIQFVSEAPLELISATSTEMQGVLDTTKNTFAFAVGISSFNGFNSPLQREHFNENYMETTSFPKASFTGKILDQVDYNTEGALKVRVKGVLSIHGIERERIIDGTLTIHKGELHIQANFDVLLEDFEISIPRIMYQKIAELISIEVSASLLHRP